MTPLRHYADRYREARAQKAMGITPETRPEVILACAMAVGHSLEDIQEVIQTAIRDIPSGP